MTTTFDSFVRAVARTDPQPALAPGQLLEGNYELLERLGGGGMGVVFRARDHRLGREVAVKALRPGTESDPTLRRLFEREARATAQLLHPNIVTLHHVGDHEGHPYLVLELLAGETLAARLARRGRLPATEALAILDPVLAAVGFAHERGVLHRDLKPNNVFITIDERIKVLDFGVAVRLDAEPPGPATRTAGTPGYMPPEQRDGASQDPRTDVYAAALLLVECLTGRRPDTASPPPLGELDVPPRVRGVLERALAADPEQRPASASELRSDLAHASGKLAPQPRRRRLPVVLACAITAIAAVIATRLATRSSPMVVTGAELNGRSWHVNYGEMLLHVEADGSAYGVYDQGTGIMVGRFEDGRFRGWWCQAPSRRPPDEAGQVELHFVHGDGRILMEGLWTYGDGRQASWQNNFYGVSLESAPTYTLEQRLQHHELCPH